MSKSIILDPGVFRLVPTGASPHRRPPRPPAPPPPKPPDLEAIRAQAFAAGRREGRAAAESELAAREADRQARWEGLEQELDAYLDRLEKNVSEQAVCLSIKLAELIIRRELPDAPMLLSLLAEGLGHVTDVEKVVVRIHPDDAVLLRPELEGKSGRIPSAGRIQLLEDGGLVPGDLVVENGFGCLDARISQRLEVLQEQLLERVRRPNADENA